MGHKPNTNHWGDELPSLAQAVVDFFHQADNSQGAPFFDLDPRPGHVRLGETRAIGPLASYASKVRGLMNAKGDLQAVLSRGADVTIVTISDAGQTISRQSQDRCETLRIAPLFSQTA